MLIQRLQIGVFAIVLEVVELQGDHGGLVDVHRILTLSDCVRHIQLGPSLECLQLTRKINAPVRVVRELIHPALLLRRDRGSDDIAHRLYHFADLSMSVDFALGSSVGAGLIPGLVWLNVILKQWIPQTSSSKWILFHNYFLQLFVKDK